MTQAPVHPPTTSYNPPTIEPLGTLRTLTKGAGPGGKPIVMATGGGIPGLFLDAPDSVPAAN